MYRFGSIPLGVTYPLEIPFPLLKDGVVDEYPTSLKVGLEAEVEGERLNEDTMLLIETMEDRFLSLNIACPPIIGAFGEAGLIIVP